MKNMLALLVGAILLTGSASAQTADAAGTWDISVNTPNGPIAALLILKKDGEKLTGSISGPQGEVAVEGSQKDKTVSVNFIGSDEQWSNGHRHDRHSGRRRCRRNDDFGEWSGKWRELGRRRAPQRTAQLRPISRLTSRVHGPSRSTWRERRHASVTFKQDGEKLSGTYSSQMLGELPLTGTIKGNDITFGFQASSTGTPSK